METKSIYEIIKENIVNGELPEDFSLPKDAPNDKIVFADGASDGIGIYHMGSPQISEESLKLLDEIMHNVTENDFETAHLKLRKFSKNNSAFGVIDDFEGFILKNTDWIDPQKLYRFANECIMSDSKEIIKFGLEMIEVFSEPNDDLKEIIRTLGLSDEFTIFAVFNMLNGWKDGNNEIFKLAKKVHGWGRIHAVKRLESESEEIREWFLKEGIKNNIMEEYSALDVYGKTNVGELLKNEISQDKFESVAEIIGALLCEGPEPGISEIEDSENMLGDFLRQVNSHELTFEIIYTVFLLSMEEEFQKLKPDCDEILNKPEAREIIVEGLHRGKGIPIAQYLGIEFEGIIYNFMLSDFEKACYNCGFLIRNDEYREKTFDIFRKKLPINEMEGEPEDNMGIGREYKNYRILSFLVQELAPYVMEGTDFVELALRSPVTNNRAMALRAIEAWCEKKKCSIKELSDELYNSLEALKEKEPIESLKKRIEKLV